jgi:hypothetical protein
MLAGDDNETIFIQRRGQPLDNKQQVTLHEAHRHGCTDGRKNPDPGSLRDGAFLPLLLLLCLPFGIIGNGLLTGFGLRMMHRAVWIRAYFLHGALPASFSNNRLGGEFARLVFRPPRQFPALGLFVDDGCVLVARQNAASLPLLAVRRTDLYELRLSRNFGPNVCVHLGLIAAWVGAGVLFTEVGKQ